MNTVILPAICDRAAARSVYPELIGSIGDAKVAIDASGVERVGQSMLQLLVSAAETEGGIALNSPSEPFLKAISLAGLQGTLGADITDAGAK
ncbi:STAS domain-containing protein [Erythrobacter longus]|nr:STAS domain-containing protein [Erythrobacter longus]